MNKFFVCFFLCIASICLAEVPESARSIYASRFYRAFEMQCYGKSASAYAQFRSAYDEAIKAGESIAKLAVIEKLFIWYRTYGTSCSLFAEAPKGWDKIQGEYKNPNLTYGGDYQSEWGKTPEQASLVRTFMFGVGECISGVFCVVVGSLPIKATGVSLCIDGFYRMYDSLNSAYALHERAILDLKKCEEAAKKIEGIE